MKRSKTIFIALLDWGLGHATRCVPVINYLLEQGCLIQIGGNGQSLIWLKKRYPQLTFHQLPEYSIRYSKNVSQAFSIMKQWPKIRRAINEEIIVIDQLVRKHQFDAIISDNRYGCHHHSIPSYLLTHQLHLQPPAGFAFLQSIIDSVLLRFIQPFNELWIPDEEGDHNLSGALSHPPYQQLKHRYCGLLSRFESYQEKRKQYDVLAVLSGPEPHRGSLEKKLLYEFKQKPHLKTCIVRGVKEDAPVQQSHHHIRMIDQAGEKELKELIECSDLIVCRSGYSSLMDLQHSNKKLLLIPTPGQTEQEYLAKYLQHSEGCLIQKQADVNIQHAINDAKPFSLHLQVNEKMYRVLHDSILR